MQSVSQAQKKILEAATSITDTETIDLLDALNRVAAFDIHSDINVPPADNSAMDGYAVCAKDVPEAGIKMEVSSRICAGDSPSALKPGTAARIFTGAEIPSGANAVIIQENTELVPTQSRIEGSNIPKENQETKFVIFNQAAEIAKNIRPKGQDIAKGEVVISAGTKLDPAHIGLIAAIGMNKVTVKRRLKVALISTGNELLEPGQPAESGKIYNSNRPLISSFLSAMNCSVTKVATVPDNLEATQKILAESADMADLVISIGGVSVGEEDHIKPAVESLGHLDLWKINIKPGKPVAFGHIRNTLFIGLPGNPVSSFVSFMMFCCPLIKRMQGRQDTELVSFKTPALFTIDKGRTRPEYMRVKVSSEGAEKFSNQSSGVLTSVAWANAVALIPSHETINQGDSIEVFPFKLNF